MASERDEVLKAVISSELPQATKLEEAISEGSSEAESTKQLELIHKHAIDKLNVELGTFGRLFGTEVHAPLVIAFFVVASGLILAAWLWWIAYYTNTHDFWAGEAHIALGAATTALGYVFGRSSKDSSK
jgi:hypothetical protein